MPKQGKTQVKGILKTPTATNDIVAKAIASHKPMGFWGRVVLSFKPDAMIKPADTAPMPFRAPCATGLSDTPPNKMANPKTNTNGPHMSPATAAKAPCRPKYLPPSIKHKLTTLGPGITWATDHSSTNCAWVSHFLRSTNSLCTTTSTPPTPWRASKVNTMNNSVFDWG